MMEETLLSTINDLGAEEIFKIIFSPATPSVKKLLMIFLGEWPSEFFFPGEGPLKFFLLDSSAPQIINGRPLIAYVTSYIPLAIKHVYSMMQSTEKNAPLTEKWSSDIGW